MNEAETSDANIFAMLANINCNPLPAALKFKTLIESRHILSLSISNYTVIPRFDFCSPYFDCT